MRSTNTLIVLLLIVSVCLVGASIPLNNIWLFILGLLGMAIMGLMAMHPLNSK